MLDFKLYKLWLGAFCMTIRGRLTVDQSSVYRIILHSNEKKILWMRLEEEPQWQSLRDYEYWLRCEMLFMLHLHDLQDYILKIKCDKCFYEPILLLDFFSGSLWAYLTTTTITTTTFACYLEKKMCQKEMRRWTMHDCRQKQKDNTRGTGALTLCLVTCQMSPNRVRLICLTAMQLLPM